MISTKQMSQKNLYLCLYETLSLSSNKKISILIQIQQGIFLGNYIVVVVQSSINNLGFFLKIKVIVQKKGQIWKAHKRN